MAASEDDVSLVDEDHAAFITSGVSIAIASTGASGDPSVTRGWGCRVSTDRRTVTVFVAPMQAGALLADLRAGRPVAVVFSMPSSHRTIQLKAPGADVSPCSDSDRQAIAEYARLFAIDLDRVGHGGDFAEAYLNVVSGLLASVSFVPTEAYAQTPGPRAGQALGR